jgi:N-acetylmuramoyl-L-alanine amidase
MSRKIYLSAGHTNVVGLDRGASGNGYIEGILTVELRDMIACHLRSMGINAVTDPNENALSKTIAFFKRLVGVKDIAVDIHFNAATPVATGTEVFVPDEPTSFERNLATDICIAMSKSLGIFNRGVKRPKDSARGSLGWMGIPCENILIEVCFISNPNDMAKYVKYADAMARSVAIVLRNYSSN